MICMHPLPEPEPWKSYRYTLPNPPDLSFSLLVTSSVPLNIPPHLLLGPLTTQLDYFSVHCFVRPEENRSLCAQKVQLSETRGRRLTQQTELFSISSFRTLSLTHSLSLPGTHTYVHSHIRTLTHTYTHTYEIGRASCRERV